jgi:hypothetical protein
MTAMDEPPVFALGEFPVHLGLGAREGGWAEPVAAEPLTARPLELTKGRAPAVKVS